MELLEKDISLKMLGRVLPLLDQLPLCGAERDTAGNRRLFFDDYARLVLVYLLNPWIDSISMLQRAAALPKLVETLYRSNRNGKPHHVWRVHTVLDLEHGVPTVMRLTGGSPRGADNERRVLEAAVEKNRLYVVDRGYFDKKLQNRIVQAQSSDVFRMPQDIQYELIEPRLVSQAALAAGVLSDAVVAMEGLDHPARLVIVRAEEHAKRTRNGYVPNSGRMLPLCNDLQLDAERISLLYRYRWTREGEASRSRPSSSSSSNCWAAGIGSVRLSSPKSASERTACRSKSIAP